MEHFRFTKKQIPDLTLPNARADGDDDVGGGCADLGKSLLVWPIALCRLPTDREPSNTSNIIILCLVRHLRLNLTLTKRDKHYK